MKVSICSYTEEDKLLSEKIIKYVRREAARKYTYLEKAIFYHTPEVSEKVKCIGANYSKLFYNPKGVMGNGVFVDISRHNWHNIK